MRIGFDAKRLFANFTGLGNYSRTLVRGLITTSPDNDYFLLTPKVTKNSETAYFTTNPRLKVIQPTRLSLLWRSFGLLQDLKQHKINVYHGLSHELPWGIDRCGIASVVTIHDLIYKLYPEQYYPWDNLIYDYKFKHACRVADRIVAISESTKHDICRLFGTDDKKIEVIYQSCDERFFQSATTHAIEDVRKRYRLPSQYSLYVGSLIERKNLHGCIEALARLRKDLRHPFVIIGRGDLKYQKMVLQKASELGIQDYLLPVDASFEDLPIIYQQANVFLYPSFAEGFGIPVLEALSSRVPVITSLRSSLPEAGGPSSCLVDPQDPHSIAHAWTTILEDSTLQEKMKSEGEQYSLKFRAPKIIPRWLKLYKSLA